MRIVTLTPGDAALIDALVPLSLAGNRGHSPMWLTTADEAREEINEALLPHKVCRILFGDDGAPLGWVGAAPFWGCVRERHPMIIERVSGRGLDLISRRTLSALPPLPVRSP